MITTIEQSKKLKELGFREPTRAYYIDGSIDYNNPINWNTNEGLDEEGNEQEEDEYCSAPSVSEALQWIRDEFRVCWVQFDYADGINWYGMFMKDDVQMSLELTGCFDTYPLAESALLTEVLDYLIEKKK